MAVTGVGAEDATAAISVDLVDNADGTSATTSSESGLEFLAGELSLIRGCSNGEIPKWVSSTESWDCSADSTGGTPSFDTIATGTNTTADMIVGEGATIIIAPGGINEATEVLNTVHNDSGATLFACTAVYLNGFDVPADLPDVLIADADATGAAIGLMFADFTTGSDALVVVSGQMDDLDTVTGEGWTVGDTLYLNDSGTSADNDCGNTLTNVRPANTDDIIQALAKVERVHATQGRLEVFAGVVADLPNLPNDLVWIGSATNFPTGTTLPDSDGATQKLQYDQATNAFVAGTDDDVPESGDFGNADDLETTGAISSGAVASAEIATDGINLVDLDDGADTPIAGECLAVATGPTDIEYVDCNAGILDGDVPDTITIDLAATATALAADPADCGAGTKAISIVANGDLT